eukprot:1159268-Pelagomonas_calceolata.AAC.13
MKSWPTFTMPIVAGQPKQFNSTNAGFELVHRAQPQYHRALGLHRNAPMLRRRGCGFGGSRRQQHQAVRHSPAPAAAAAREGTVCYVDPCGQAALGQHRPKLAAAAAGEPVQAPHFRAAVAHLSATHTP